MYRMTACSRYIREECTIDYLDRNALAAGRSMQTWSIPGAVLWGGQGARPPVRSLPPFPPRAKLNETGCKVAGLGLPPT